jgi:hypothetical protein
MKRYKSKTDGKEHRVDEKIKTTCPCGGKVSIGYDGEGRGVVMHAMPMCEDFEKKDPMDYMTWLRRKTVGYFPGEDS